MGGALRTAGGATEVAGKDLVAAKDLANAIRFLAMDAVARRNPAIPACRWAWPTSRPCCSPMP